MLAYDLVAHGAPTLARLKVGSLLNVSYQDFAALEEEIASLNALMLPKGVTLTLLRRCSEKALIYLYRPAHLAQLMQREDVQLFLRSFGYNSFTEDEVLCRLREHLAGCGDFPHEIGVFLGYPLADVEAFIRHNGQNFLCVGCWKVYTNECDALRVFAQFRKCKKVYTKLFSEGFPLSRLTVATQ